MTKINNVYSAIFRLRQQKESSSTNQSAQNQYKNKTAIHNTRTLYDQNHIKAKLHQLLQSVDLNTPEGKQEGRKLFIESALSYEFGTSTTERRDMLELINIIESGLTGEQHMLKKFDVLLVSLKKSAN